MIPTHFTINSPAAINSTCLQVRPGIVVFDVDENLLIEPEDGKGGVVDSDSGSGSDSGSESQRSDSSDHGLNTEPDGIASGCPVLPLRHFQALHTTLLDAKRQVSHLFWARKPTCWAMCVCGASHVLH